MSPITAIQTSPSMSTASASANPKAQQLDRAAHQFEAMLLQEMLKPLGQHADISGENSDGGEGSSSPLESFGIEAIAGSLAPATRSALPAGSNRHCSPPEKTRPRKRRSLFPRKGSKVPSSDADKHR